MRIALSNLNELRTSTWEAVRGLLADDLERAQATINTSFSVSHDTEGEQRDATRGSILGQLRGTLAEQPTGLGPDSDGLLYFVADYGHMVAWNGSLSRWEFAPGDCGNGFFRDFAITPQETGWQLCDGSTVAYLVVGAATLTTSNFTTPNLNGSNAYRKSAGSYSGTINAAGATSSDGGHDHGGATGSGGDHDHGGLTGNSDGGIGGIVVTSGVVLAVEDYAHKHYLSASGTHTHTVSSGGGHTHTTGEPANMLVKAYFRR
jgi:hypothetical protein